MTIRTAATAAALAMLASQAPAADRDYSSILERIKLPEGFSISIFAEVPKAR